MERKEGKSYGQSKLRPCWLMVWQLNSPSFPLHHLGPPALPVQDHPKGKAKLKWEPWDEQALEKQIQFSKNDSFHGFTQVKSLAFGGNPSNNSETFHQVSEPAEVNIPILWEMPSDKLSAFFIVSWCENRWVLKSSKEHVGVFSLKRFQVNQEV